MLDVADVAIDTGEGVLGAIFEPLTRSDNPRPNVDAGEFNPNEMVFVDKPFAIETELEGFEAARSDGGLDSVVDGSGVRIIAEE